ncbi:hypothetical protein SESBI_21615 [Sesbania bispinosa]|nr:hypothetical protein SESBI_21615 [Sesbania bispinosa]
MIAHCLRDCPSSNAIWEGVGLADYGAANMSTSLLDWLVAGVSSVGPLFLAALWSIWQNRNQQVFQNISRQPWEIVHSIRSLASIFHSVFAGNVDIDAPHNTVRWISWNRPSLNQVALNTDGSVSINNAMFGGLLRNHDGSWIMGYYGL